MFDVKLGENFRRKACFVADGHKVELSPSLTHSSAVSQDSVRTLLTIAALNEFDIQGADPQNAFLTAPNREKTWTQAGRQQKQDNTNFDMARALFN